MCTLSTLTTKVRLPTTEVYPRIHGGNSVARQKRIKSGAKVRTSHQFANRPEAAWRLVNPVFGRVTHRVNCQLILEKKTMGGWGSGEYMRLAVKNSRRVNQFDAVDIRQYRKMYRLQPGNPATVEFEYSLRGGPPFIPLSAAIVWVPYHFGLRPFFECPVCGRRCCLLYLAERCACRQCLRLSYPVQFETKLDQGFRRAWKARMKLVQPDGRSACGDWIPDWRKPKGMHWTTFNRLRDEAAQKAVELWEGPAADWVKRWDCDCAPD